MRLQNGGDIIGGTGGLLHILGKGGAGTGSSNFGVIVTGGGATINSLGADVLIEGAGGGVGGGASLNHGVRADTGGVIAAGGAGNLDAGNLDVIGRGSTSATAGGNFGVTVINGGSMFTSAGGPVRVIGVAGAGAGSIGIHSAAGGAYTTATNGGSLTLASDVMSLSGVESAGAGLLTVRPANSIDLASEDNGDAINLGSAGGNAVNTLELSQAELDTMTAGTLQIGDTNSGAIIVSAALTIANHLSITTGTGVTFNEAVTMAADKNLTVSALGTSNGTINFATATADLAASGTGAISLTTARNITAGSGASLSVVNGALTLIANASGATTGAFIGIDLSGATLTTSGTGSISLTGKGGAGSTAHSLVGVSLQLDAVMQSTLSGATAGGISVTGTGGGTGISATDYGVEIGGGQSSGVNNTRITSVSGAIVVTGTGGTGNGGGQVGIDIRDGGQIISTGTGATAASITLIGTGSAGAGPTNPGLAMGSTNGNFVFGAAVTSVDGAISITGTGAANGSYGAGILLGQGARVAASGTGSVSLTGTGPTGTGPGLEGVYIDGEHANGQDTQVTAANGNLTITGTATDPAFSGIFIGSPAFVSTSGAGSITLIADRMSLAGAVNAGAQTATLRQLTNGQLINLGGADSASTLGLSDAELDFVTAGTVQIGDANSGAITVSAAITRADTANLVFTSGAGITVNSSISFGGNLLLTAGGSDQPISIQGTLTKASGGNATAILKATGDVRFENSADLTVSSGALALTLNADSDANSAGGVLIDPGSVLASNGGDVTIGGGASPGTTQTGGLVAGQSGTGFVINYGVVIVNGAAINAGAGNISIRGHGRDGVPGEFTVGVEIQTTVTTTTGNITIAGTGGSGNGSSSGLQLGFATIESTSGGSISLTGVGQSDLSSGVALYSAVVRTTGTGTITIQGTGFAAGTLNSYGIWLRNTDSSITVAGSGAITLTGSGGSASSGLNFESPGPHRIGFDGTNAYSGNIVINADSMSITNSVIQTTGTVTLRQQTNGTLINLGGADSASTLGLTDAELDQVTAGTLQIGDANSGAITVSAAITHGNHLSITTGGGVIFNDAVTMATDKNLTVSALGTSNGTINFANANADLTASGTGAISLTTARDFNMFPTTGWSVTTADGNITLNANQQTTQTAGSFYGVQASDGLIEATGSGNIVINARGGITAAANFVAGVAIDPNTTVRTNTGSITMSGVGGQSDTGGNNGIQVHSGSVVESTGGGSIDLTGIGGLTSGAGQALVGIRVLLGGTVRTTGTGTITLTGTGGAVSAASDNYGVRIDNAGAVTNSGSGTITINATGGANNAPAFRTDTGTNRLGFDGTNAYSGNIIINADSMDISGVDIQTTGTVAFLEKTTGILINLGAADSTGVLGLTDAELDQITADTVQIGNSSSGAITVSAAITLANHVSLTSGGDVTGSGALALAAGKNLTINGGENVILTGALAVPGTLSILPSGETMASVTLTNAANAFGTVMVAGASNISLRDDGGFDLGAIDIGNLLTVQSDGPITQSDALSGSGGLTKLGSGTLALSQANSYGGTTTVTAGTLEVAASGALPPSPLVLDGGTILYNTAGSEQGGDVTLNADSTVEVGANTSVNWTGNLIGPGRTLTKTGPGILSHGAEALPLVTIAGVSVSAGAIISFKSDGFGTSPIDIATGAALWVTTTEGETPILSNAIALHGGAGESVIHSGFTNPGALVMLAGGGGGVVFTGNLTLSGDNTINPDGGDITLAGVVSGPGTLTKIAANTLTLGNKKNTFGSASTITVTAGTLAVGLVAGTPGATAAADAMLGNIGNSLVFSGGNFAVTNGFTTLRHFSRTVDTNIDITTGTLKLLGTVDGNGVITQTGAGSLVFGEDFVGGTVVDMATGPVAVGAAKFAIEGEGSAVITIVSDGLGGKKIEEIALSNTTATTEIVIKGPTTLGATLVVERITSTDPEPEIASITLKKGVILGDGLDDNVPDINIAGKIGKLTVDTVMPNTIIRLGYGLTYNNTGDDTTPDTYNNRPNVSIKSITGSGVIIDVTGDGQPAGTGGGGLGKVVISSWLGTGTIRTTQGIGSFTLRTGDCNVVFEVDKNHTGELTTANVGKMVIQNGSWGSSVSDIEGNVGAFNAVGFLAGATFSAGSFTKFTVKTGTFAGTATFTNPDATEVGTISVGSDFLGKITSAASIKNVKVKGDFKGSLVAQSIGSITAYLFDGTKPTDAGDYGNENRHNIVALNGSLGTLKTKSGGIAHYDIYAASLAGGLKVKALAGFGVDDVTFDAAQIQVITSNLPIANSVFAARDLIGKITVGDTTNPSGILNAKFLSGVNLGGDGVLDGAVTDTYTLAARIGKITIKGALSQTVISAGFTPGSDLIWGNADDTAALTGVLPILPLKAIDSIALAIVAGATTDDPVSNTIQAASFKGIKVGATTILLSGFPKDVAAGQTGSADDIRFRIV